MHPNRSFKRKPWPRERVPCGLAFQTRGDLVVCAKDPNDSDPDSDSDSDPDSDLSVCHLTDCECTFSVIKITKYSDISLAPDGLTVVIIKPHTVSCYSWNHDTTQFDPLHFADEAHLVGYQHVYSPDGKFLACRSQEDYNIRVWDTRTGQLCGKPITPDGVGTIALSPALNDQFLGGRIIAVSCSNTISVFDVRTSRLYARFHAPKITYWPHMSFIQDETKLALHLLDKGTMRIWDLRAECSHATRGYELILQGRENGWMIDQDSAPLLWVPSEHRRSLWVPRPGTVTRVPREKETMLDLSTSRLGNKWTECIDEGWLKALEEKELTRKLLE